jgi:hypothetical protein
LLRTVLLRTVLLRTVLLQGASLQSASLRGARPYRAARRNAAQRALAGFSSQGPRYLARSIGLRAAAAGGVSSGGVRSWPVSPLAGGIGRILNLFAAARIGLGELTGDNEHFEFFWFPHSEGCLTKRNNRTDGPARPLSRFRYALDGEFLASTLFGATGRLGHWTPRG